MSLEKIRNNKAVFLDRDGTLIEHIPYLSDPKKLKLFPDTVASIKSLRAAGFLTILVTNQSGIGRGFISENELSKIHNDLNAMLSKEGALLDAIYYCEHHPDDKCICRKPNPGMLLAASERFKIDLNRSYIIGDDPKDVEAGSRAGCNTVLLSCGQKDNISIPIAPSFQAETLSSATEWILRNATSLQELQEMEDSGLTDIR